MTDKSTPVEEITVGDNNEIACSLLESNKQDKINDEETINSKSQPKSELPSNELDKNMADESNQKDDDKTQVITPQKDATESIATTSTTQNTISPPTRLPVARIKRIVKQDEDITAISTPAVYAVAAATVSGFNNYV